MLTGRLYHCQPHSENEAAIRHLLRHYTSYTQISRPECECITGAEFSPCIDVGNYARSNTALPVTRILTQKLSNIVTANEDLIEKLWNDYLQLPEEQLILMYISISLDLGTSLTGFLPVD